MKHIALGTALFLSCVSWSVSADEQGSMHGKASTEQQCKAMAEQHGMKGDKMDDWVKKCMEMSGNMKSSKEMDDNNDMNDMSDTNNMDDTNDMNDDSDMQDPEDGDSGMGGDND